LRPRVSSGHRGNNPESNACRWLEQGSIVLRLGVGVGGVGEAKRNRLTRGRGDTGRERSVPSERNGETVNRGNGEMADTSTERLGERARGREGEWGLTPNPSPSPSPRPSPSFRKSRHLRRDYPESSLDCLPRRSSKNEDGSSRAVIRAKRSIPVEALG